MIRGASQMGKSFARQRSQRFNWKALVSPYTSPDFVAFCEGSSKEISAKTVLASSIPKTIPQIDWAHWKNTIKSPGVVEEMQKEYESIVFQDASADAFTPLKAKNLHMVAVAEAGLGSVKVELAAADKAILAIQEMKKDGFHWTADKWTTKIPGLEAQLKDQFENEDYLPSDQEEKIAALDFGDLAKDFKAGTMEGQPADSIGDLSLAEERAIIEAGDWTIARLYTDRAGREGLLAQVRASNAAAAAAAEAMSSKSA